MSSTENGNKSGIKVLLLVLGVIVGGGLLLLCGGLVGLTLLGRSLESKFTDISEQVGPATAAPRPKAPPARSCPGGWSTYVSSAGWMADTYATERECQIVLDDALSVFTEPSQRAEMARMSSCRCRSDATP